MEPRTYFPENLNPASEYILVNVAPEKFVNKVESPSLFYLIDHPIFPNTSPNSTAVSRAAHKIYRSEILVTCLFRMTLGSTIGGVIVGFSLGTLSLPVIGSLIGAVCGLILGFSLGIVNGLTIGFFTTIAFNSVLKVKIYTYIASAITFFSSLLILTFGWPNLSQFMLSDGSNSHYQLITSPLVAEKMLFRSVSSGFGSIYLTYFYIIPLVCAVLCTLHFIKWFQKGYYQKEELV